MKKPPAKNGPGIREYLIPRSTNLGPRPPQIERSRPCRVCGNTCSQECADFRLTLTPRAMHPLTCRYCGKFTHNKHNLSVCAGRECRDKERLRISAVVLEKLQEHESGNHIQRWRWRRDKIERARKKAHERLKKKHPWLFEDDETNDTTAQS